MRRKKIFGILTWVGLAVVTLSTIELFLYSYYLLTETDAPSPFWASLD